MAKYVTGKIKPTMHWADDVPLLPQLQVDGIDWVDTGLITSTGETIMRLPEPMGFHNPKE